MAFGRKEVEKLVMKLKYRDSGSLNAKNGTIEKSGVIWKIYHFGTLILTYNTATKHAELGGGYSRTDQMIINTFFRSIDSDKSVSRIGGSLHF